MLAPVWGGVVAAGAGLVFCFNISTADVADAFGVGVGLLDCLGVAAAEAAGTPDPEATGAVTAGAEAVGV